MKNHKLLLPLLLIAFQLGAGCEQLAQKSQPPYSASFIKSKFGYNLDQPDQKYFMGYELEEISGISYYGPQQLACVQDEEGKLYVYSLQEKKVIQRIKFNKSGDYEGVEIIDNMAYVLRSDGQLFKFPTEQETEASTEKIETPLSIKNDAEGLGYHPQLEMLLIACKGQGEIDEKKVKGKAVYGFKIKEQQFVDKPLFSITKKDIKKFLKTEAEDKKQTDFSPSAIAWHPLEHRYYILASVGRVLVVVNPEFEIEEFIRLHPKTYKQPEGICFAPNGDMYIASEGRTGDGYILEFKYKQDLESN